MSCYSPIVGVWNGEYTENKRKKYRLSWRLDPSLIDPADFRYVVIPCGKCLGCRLDYAKHWSDRMLLELDVCQKAFFLTLTYDDEHFYKLEIPELSDGYQHKDIRNVSKRDCQLFMKSLREEFKDRKIRFFLSSEYGPKTFRCHYHAIIFGLDLDDFPDREVWNINELKQKTYTSEKLDKIWKRGRAVIAECTEQTCNYVARYITSKALSGFTPSDVGAAREFTLMSRKPGIGVPYMYAHPDCLDSPVINLSTEKGGRKIYLPRLFSKELEKRDKLVYDDRMMSYKVNMMKEIDYRDKTNPLPYLDQLEVDQAHALSVCSSLVRDVE